MVEISAHLGMVLVNKAAGVFRLLAPSRGYNNFAAVWDTEQLFVMRVNESDAFLGIFHVPVEPFFHIAVAVKIIVALCRIAAEQ